MTVRDSRGRFTSMTEAGLTKNKIISELTRSPHGNLKEYVPVASQASKADPEFMAHLIAWDAIKGQVRDAKVALPIIYLAANPPVELAGNALAHFEALGFRELLRAYRFALELRPTGYMRQLRAIIQAKLSRSDHHGLNDRVLLQHRNTLKELYALTHTKPSDYSNEVLFKGARPAGSLFDVVARLGAMSPTEAASEIVGRRIPFLIAQGALGTKIKEPALLLALIDRMTPTELITNTKNLEKWGMRSNPALRGAFEKKLEEVSKSSKNVLKTTEAAQAVSDDSLRQKLQGAQDRQLAAKGVEGNWLVLADKSGSMANAIEVARHVSAVLAKMVKGKVWLVFFDTSPQTIDVTGAALDHIKKATQYISAGGGTSIGCGLKRMLDEKVEVDGIAIVSDGGENNTPYFPQVYKQYAEAFNKEVPVYFYECDVPYSMMSPLEHNMKLAGIDLQKFNLSGNIDFYSLPNLVATMRTNRYSLVDEIMATPLKTFTAKPKEEPVNA